MKAIFLFLLVTNFLYLGYELFFKVEASSTSRSVQAPLAGERIKLLEEVEPAKDSPRMPSRLNEAMLQNLDEPQNCEAVGPFLDVVLAREAVVRLAEIDSKIVLQAIDSKNGQNDFRVMIPPAPSAEEAFRKLRELKSRRIDSYVITQGDEALGISLGVFSTREAATQLQASLAELGYAARIVELPRVSRQFWLFSAVSPNLILPDSVWKGLKETYPNLESRKQQCIRS